MLKVPPSDDAFVRETSHKARECREPQAKKTAAAPAVNCSSTFADIFTFKHRAFQCQISIAATFQVSKNSPSLTGTETTAIHERHVAISAKDRPCGRNERRGRVQHSRRGAAFSVRGARRPADAEG